MAGAERTFTVRLLGDATGAQRAFSDVAGSAEHTESRFGAFASGVGRSMAAAGLAVGGLAAASVPMINAATDLAETQSKVGVIFGDAAGQINAFAADAAKSLGQSKQQAMDAAATFAVFGKSAGLSGGDLATFSTDLTALASDLASFNNTSPDEAIQAIGAALRGEAEPMRRYGVLLDDATMRQKAFEMGLISSTKEALTPANKVLAAQALIMEKTADAQGDFARTSDGLANKQRILSAQFANVQAQIGEKLLPVALRLATWASETMIPALLELGSRLEGPLTNAFTTVSRVMRDDILPVVQAVFGWLRDNVPPTIEAVRTAIETTVGAIVAYWNRHFEDIRAVAELVFGIVRTIVETALGAIEAFWRTWGGTITRYVTDLFDAIRQVIQGALDVIRGIMDVVMGLIRGDWGRVWDGIKQIVDGIWQAINGVIDQAINVMRTAIEIGMRAVAGIFDAIADAIVGAVRWMAGGIAGFVGDIVSTLAGWVVSVWQLGGEVIGFFREIPGRIGDFFGGLAETILSPFREAFNAIARLWNRTVGSLSFSVPDWVPGIGGRGWSVPDIPEFHQGGIVPGTGEMLALLEGGEGVFTREQMRAMDGQGQNVSVVVNVSGGLGGPERIGAATADAVRRELAVLLRGAVA